MGARGLQQTGCRRLGDASSSPNLELLAEASVNQDTFELSNTPVEDTIEVTVDGSVVSGWSYRAGVNAVVLDAPATSGQEVEIRYEGAGGCG